MYYPKLNYGLTTNPDPNVHIRIKSKMGAHRVNNPRVK